MLVISPFHDIMCFRSFLILVLKCCCSVGLSCVFFIFVSLIEWFWRRSNKETLITDVVLVFSILFWKIRGNPDHALEGALHSVSVPAKLTRRVVLVHSRYLGKVGFVQWNYCVCKWLIFYEPYFACEGVDTLRSQINQFLLLGIFSFF